MKNSRIHTYTIVALSLVLSAAVAVIISSCGGSTTPSQSTTGTVKTYISDPAVCSSNSSPTGDFSSVYVTITKVTANVNADAGPNDSGWQTVVDLTKNPMQIDLLSLESKTCLLTELGNTSLPAGKYQQIRLYLLSNNPSSGTPVPSSNSCTGAGWNCVVPNSGGPEELQLSSEAQTGIKIPSSQIASGGLTVAQGEGVDLGINFDTCDSLVHQGNHMWRLKPVLHASEVTTNSDTLTGTVVDANTQKPIPDAVVSLEQPEEGVDTVSIATTTDADGNFSFCNNNLDMGATYDVVVTAMDTSGMNPITYNATVTLNVPVGSALGKIPMVPESNTASGPAKIVGQVTTTSASTTTGAGSTDATAATITVSTLQAAGTSKIVTIPPFSGTATFTTGTKSTLDNGVSVVGSCQSGTDCENYLFKVPASNPSVGTFTRGQTTNYSSPAPNPALYWVQAIATLPGEGDTADCTPSVIPSTFTAGTTSPGNQIGVDPPPATDSTATQNFGFVQCTAGK